MSFPFSFPIDVRHLLLENVTEQLLEMWDGSYKAGTMLGDSNARHSEPYVISKAALEELDVIIASSRKLIPSRMSGTLTAISNRWRWTVDTHLFFLVSLGPIILKPYLPRLYFDHFLDLSEVTKRLIALSIDVDEHLPLIEDGLRRWVAQFDS